MNFNTLNENNKKFSPDSIFDTLAQGMPTVFFGTTLSKERVCHGRYTIRHWRI
jgi:hypothetical protein